jgi:glycosyltransferase involved in cell wall biosynthesis
MPSEVQDQLLQARVLVLPSQLGDGVPNAILEAMACGVPVIATRTAGIPDVVQHEDTGFLFEPGQREQMAHYLNRLLDDDKLWQRMSENSLSAIQSYSWGVVAPRVERALLQVISAVPYAA